MTEASSIGTHLLLRVSAESMMPFVEMPERHRTSQAVRHDNPNYFFVIPAEERMPESQRVFSFSQN